VIGAARAWLRWIVALVPGLPGPVPAQEAPGGALFASVHEVLADRYFDRRFREAKLDELAAEFAPAARAAQSLAEERAVVHAFLACIPASHLALYSKTTHAALFADLNNRRRPTFGFDVQQLGGRFFVRTVLEGGPAEAAGLRRGDEVLTLDQEPTGGSRRLDWRSDDAALPDLPTHAILVGDEPDLVLAIARRPGQRTEVALAARGYSKLEAAKASGRVVERNGRRIGCVHLHMMHMTGVGQLLTRFVERELLAGDALVVDLRGRGGSALAVEDAQRALEKIRARIGGDVFALIDCDTRSAKEVLAFELQQRGLATLVGERTAGAVIPATFADVGFDSILMFPSMTLGSYTKELEGRGVEPDVAAADALPWAAGDDPILEAALAIASPAAAPRTRPR
jgi:carboxyl-terminal processing protease